ncbi:hypothetical protein F7725_004762 [Dissostichus mawsoni]|uniref:Large ribosomal subunit protein mL48 n=1 Tax=Dissostichus mawsoni TaxID=36200 RepID=A0A7J5XMC0_DISMA|nr:hypothetical protein F7725_004762 [Dissostichus mawsoni]
MNAVFRKVSATQQAFVLNQALTTCRATPSIQHPVWASVNERQYKSMPTHGIGRWRHLLPKDPPKKKRDRQQMKEIVVETETTYATLNVNVSGYDMTVVEHFSQHIHNLCNRLGIKVLDCYALQTKTTEVWLMQEQGTKMSVDSFLKTHNRVVQLRSLSATVCPIFLEVLLKNQPEGVQLSVQELCFANQDHEVWLMQEQGTKMSVDSFLKTHNRVVQLRSLSATVCPIFLEVLLKNQPEGVQLSVQELCFANQDHEVWLMQEQGTKMSVDSFLKTHNRVAQLRSLSATVCPIFLEVLLKNQPEGVQLSVQEHTEVDYKARFKGRPELEGLKAKISPRTPDSPSPLSLS